MPIRPRLLTPLFLLAALCACSLLPTVDHLLSSAHARQTKDAFTGHVVAVTAGDALDVRVGGGWTVTVRFHGVESPSTPRALREAVTRYTSRLVLDTDVRVEVRGTASRSVVYGEVYRVTGGDSINRVLAREGLARWAGTYAASRTDLRDAEAGAKRARRGLWGADDGSNIVLPPAASETSGRPLVKPAPAMTKSASRQRVAAKPLTKRDGSRAATTSPVTPSSHPAPGTIPAALPPFFLPGGVACFFLALTWLAVYGVLRGLAFGAKRLVCQILLALIAGVGSGLASALPVAALPAAFAGGAIPVMVPLALALPLLSVFLVCAGMSGVGTITRLRRAAMDPRRAEPGFVKLHGVARTATGEVACSQIGDIPGLYVREVSARYTSEVTNGRRLSSPRWVPVRERAGAVDFTIFSGSGDGTGTALVLAEQDEEAPESLAPGRWLPYHVARFYNEVPTDAWYETAYEGDTRTEVFFVPNGATLTVWGDLYPPAADARAAKDKLPTPRVAADVVTGKVLICDGPEARAYAGRVPRSLPFQISVLLIGVACGGIAAGLAVRGGMLARECVTAALGAALLALLFVAIRRGAVLALGMEAEATTGESDPLRRPAHAAWSGFAGGFPGVVIAPAVGD